MTESEAKAYRDGRQAYYGFDVPKPTEPNLLFEFKMGWKHAKSEDALDQDTEWD